MSDPTDLPNLIDWSKVRVCRVMDPRATRQLCECPPDDCARERPFATVPPTQPPAAPETDVRLTEAECAALAEALGIMVRPNGYLAVAVERIVAERVRVVEGERDAAIRERNYARRQRDEERAGKEGNWRALGEWSARAESAEAAHRALQAAVEALADEWASKPDDRRYDGDRARALRALLAGGAR